MGTLGITGGGAKLYSAGGDMLLQGRMHTAPGTACGQLVLPLSVEPRYLLELERSTSLVKPLQPEELRSDGTMEFNAWGGTVTLTSLNTASDAILIQGKASGTAASYGMWGGEHWHPIQLCRWR